VARGSRAVFLLHAGEIFYELPTENAGGFRYVHPVMTLVQMVAKILPYSAIFTIENGASKSV
jgi:hypothetical protein